jgi:hypothetical protein
MQVKKIVKAAIKIAPIVYPIVIKAIDAKKKKSPVKK